MKANAYLFFKGQCEEAFKFYARVLGGKMEALMSHEGTPAAEHVPPEWRKKILHARLNLGDSFLMGADSPPAHQQAAQGFSVCLMVDQPDEAGRVFQALSEGGAVTMPFGETFWAVRFGMCVDRFGIPWMINCERPS